MVSLDDFEIESLCVYKNERYSVRDNGAVFRYPLDGKRQRPTDNNWTFGKKNIKTGYLEIASVRIHRIVAAAFHGEAPTKEHVVDHIDTNKQNNRPCLRHNRIFILLHCPNFDLLRYFVLEQTQGIRPISSQ